MSETIRSITNCPTCGAECNIEGSEEGTHFYVPKHKYSEEEVLQLIAGWGLYLLVAPEDDTTTADDWFNDHKKK